MTGIRNHVPTCQKVTRLPTELPRRPYIHVLYCRVEMSHATAFCFRFHFSLGAEPRCVVHELHIRSEGGAHVVHEPTQYIHATKPIPSVKRLQKKRYHNTIPTPTVSYRTVVNAPYVEHNRLTSACRDCLQAYSSFNDILALRRLSFGLTLTQETA